ncbi:formate acetyltransferase activating enzyme protein [Halorhabdus tiamatea SARL4B]|uniref:Anaerobic ribonucleoside-triphosphate reductase activating protein n=1 Tax=Halorhabdus tiamatea SARL4B TaxID=1033806 RepID=F7PJA9_9EURY|nr:anaerobic ribonucleoside-triphosphate reductase activating protein [Halorhabdus tiamatea]ERJ05451.1 formate acetyltransferase activating enzyme protein [Halorhabdus tiamatea SARL4B]CCQ33565.1 anaerobic ribonucleoside-triphosphate reductase activating protein [Halorhabdus tiamatea SARL4B]
MEFGGLQRTTLSDFPGRVACAVFTAGCNLRCPYCHNPELIDGNVAPSNDSALPEDEFFAVLDDREAVIDGVVVTGGEPTLHADLPHFVSRITDRGLDVKLDTNGTRPAVLRETLDTGGVEYVAMDLKTTPDRYGELGADAGEAVERSVELIRATGIDHEFRTTFDPGVVSAADFETLGELVGDSRLVVQSVDTATVLCPDRVRETPVDPLAAIGDAVGECPSQIDHRE